MSNGFECFRTWISFTCVEGALDVTSLESMRSIWHAASCKHASRLAWLDACTLMSRVVPPDRVLTNQPCSRSFPTKLSDPPWGGPTGVHRRVGAGPDGRSEPKLRLRRTFSTGRWSGSLTVAFPLCSTLLLSMSAACLHGCQVGLYRPGLNNFFPHPERILLFRTLVIQRGMRRSCLSCQSHGSPEEAFVGCYCGGRAASPAELRHERLAVVCTSLAPTRHPPLMLTGPARLHHKLGLLSSANTLSECCSVARHISHALRTQHTCLTCSCSGCARICITDPRPWGHVGMHHACPMCV